MSHICLGSVSFRFSFPYSVNVDNLFLLERIQVPHELSGIWDDED